MHEAIGNTLLWITLRVPGRILFFTRFGLWMQSILYRYRCPGGSGPARECVRNGWCGCDNQDRYAGERGNG